MHACPAEHNDYEGHEHWGYYLTHDEWQQPSMCTAASSIVLLLLLQPLPLLRLLLCCMACRLRQWDGQSGMSSWGGPGINGQPGPECVSCFKDGINFNDLPRGFQTPEFSPDNPTSFLDAAIVFTDSAISGVPGQQAVVVLFRCGVALLAPWQGLLMQQLCH
jgi:hypothetical protein